MENELLYEELAGSWYLSCFIPSNIQVSGARMVINSGKKYATRRASAFNP